MAYEQIKKHGVVTPPREFTGTAAELAAMTAAEKLTMNVGDTFWAYDAKLAYIFANGDWRVVS